MGLLQNISLRNAEPYARIGDTSELRTSQLSRSLNKFIGGDGDDRNNIYYGIPIGNVHPTAWSLPISVGGMASLSGTIGIGVFSSSIAGGRAIHTSYINGIGQFDTINILAKADVVSTNKINGVGQFNSTDILAKSDLSSTNKLNGIGQFDSSISAIARLNSLINGTGELTPIDILAIAGIFSTNIKGAGQFLTNPILLGGINAICNITGVGNITNADLWNGIYQEDITSILAGSSLLTGELYSGRRISSISAGTSNLEADIYGILHRNLSSNITNSSSLVADIKAIANMVIEIQSLSDLSARFTAKANISADITPFTELSPESLASSVWNSIATQYTQSGTMGEAMGNASSAGDPWSTLLPGSYLSTEAGGILSQIQTLVDELHKIQGLNSSHPMTVTPNNRTSGDINLELTGDGETITVVTRI